MKKRSNHGSRRSSNTGSFGVSGVSIFRGSDGSAEKVTTAITEIFAGKLRVNVKTSEMHPDDQIVAVANLEKLGHDVRVVKNHFFIGAHFRATLDGPRVHVTDMRCYN